MLCRDRVATLHLDQFKLLTCTMCYTFLFPKNPDYMVGDPPLYLTPLDSWNSSQGFNQSYSRPGINHDQCKIYPDIHNSSSTQRICESLSSTDCERWADCCRAAVDCCNKQQAIVSQRTNATICPTTWDGYGCWGDAEPDSLSQIQCPHYVGKMYMEEYTPAMATKMCGPDGSWFQRDGIEWSDYTGCVSHYLQKLQVLSYIRLACCSVSITLLTPASIIFLLFRQLRSQNRILMHVNLFVSFILADFVFIVWEVLVYLDGFDETSEDAFAQQNSGGCKVLYVIQRYTRTASFFWMFLEGLYLHRLIVNTFRPPKHIGRYVIAGWFGSAIPIGVYALIRSFAYDKHCWIEHIEAYEWVLYAPNLLCIVINLVFLCCTLRILLTDLQFHPNEPPNYRRALRATFILVPLFGLQLFLVIYRPKPVSFAYEVIAALLTNLQGGLVAIILCYANTDALWSH